MTPIQQMYLGVGAKKKTYMDDVFSTYIYKGTGSAQSITNNLDNSGEGGLLWICRRDSSSYGHYLFDTARGNQKFITSDTSANEVTDSNTVTAFNNNGFTLGSSSYVNSTPDSFASWNFRKAPGFCDVISYTGNGVDGRTVSHSLGCAPGLVLIKNYDGSRNWFVWHRSFGLTQKASLNQNWAASSMSSSPRHALPNATTFTLTDWDEENGDGEEFVMYLFAGGESTASEAVSVDFDGSGDYLSIPDSSDFDFGSGDFTIECWAKVNSDNASNQESFINQWGSGQYGWFFGSVSDDFKFYWSTNGSSFDSHSSGFTPYRDGQWHHYAVSRNGNDLKLFVDGLQRGTTKDFSGITFHNSTNAIVIGENPDVADGSRQFNGNLSNVRVVKGTAVYTSSFKPPTEPLTNITNTKLLCCNGSSATSSTVTPGTITASGDPTASTDSPFDDPSGYVFGENGDQNAVKTGSYRGNGSDTGPEIFLGFEPQYLLIKRTSDTEDWMIFDSMRKITTDGPDADLRANNQSVEGNSNDWLDLTPTGFKITKAANHVNGVNDDYIYMAIRRSDPLVQKPAAVGTDVFTTSAGLGGELPNFISGFPVDMSLHREIGGVADWDAGTRLMGVDVLKTNETDADTDYSNWTWDYNNGWGKMSSSGQYNSWMWKRCSGFDVVNYKGNETSGHQIPHNLSKIPEMIWVKNRESTDGWFVYHKGNNGGTNPEQWYIMLHDSQPAATGSSANFWNDTVPTSTHFTLGSSADTNRDNKWLQALLFASVDGISKCGFYDGSDSEQTITTGFQPRFVILKRTSSSGSWIVLDTLRGWASGNDQRLALNTTAAQESGADVGAPTSTGFTLTGNQSDWSDSGSKYIYYAHA